MVETFSLQPFAELFVLPPANLFLLFLAGLWLARRPRRLGVALQCGAVFLLYALSTPLVAGSLLRTFEPTEPLAITAGPSSGAGAFLILSGEMEGPPPLRV